MAFEPAVVIGTVERGRQRWRLPDGIRAVLDTTEWDTGRPMQSTKRAHTTRMAGRPALLVLVAAFGLLLAPRGDSGFAHAQESGHWMLSSTIVNPPAEAPPPNWDVTTTATSMSVTETFGPDDESGAAAQFDATWSEPPAQLEPGASMELPVTVSGQVTGNRDTQFYFGLDVIIIVNDRWNNSAVGAVANCSQTTVISGVYECSEPVTNTGVLPFSVAGSGETFSVGVGALNCGAACAVRWSYDWIEGSVIDDPAGDGIVPPASVDDGGALADSDSNAESLTSSPSDDIPIGPIAVIAVVAAGAAALVIRGRSRPGTGADPANGPSTREQEQHDDDDEDDDDDRSVTIQLTHPVGPSPYVLQYGWQFGARAVVGAGAEERDVSDSIQWSGPATFTPQVGRRSSPAFHRSPGVAAELGRGQTVALSITLTVDVDGTAISRTFPVMVISTSGYARLTDTSEVAADAHGCPACPHTCVGPITTVEQASVTLGGLPVATVGDHGIHAACCGPNTYEIASGDNRVLINGKPAAWEDSVVEHCGGRGSMTTYHPGGK